MPATGFDDFYRAHREGLLVFIRQYGGPGLDAEDICGEAWARAFARWRMISEPRGWVFRVAINLAHRAGREASRARPSGDVLDFEHAAARWPWSTPMPGAEWGALVSDIRDALQRLPGQQRAAVLLDHAGWSPPEIADALGCSAGTVRGHLFRGRAKLRRFLDEPRPAAQRVAGEGLEGRMV